MLLQLYKHYHAEAIDEATGTGCTSFDKIEFLAALLSIRKKNIHEGLYSFICSEDRDYPFHPKVVLNNMREHERKRVSKAVLLWVTGQQHMLLLLTNGSERQQPESTCLPRHVRRS